MNIPFIKKLLTHLRTYYILDIVIETLAGLEMYQKMKVIIYKIAENFHTSIKLPYIDR